MREWRISLIYKIFVFIILLLSPWWVLVLIKDRNILVHRYIVVYVFQLFILIMSYTLYELRLRTYYNKIIRKTRIMNKKYGIVNSSYRKFIGLDSFYSFEYYFNEQNDKLFTKLNDLEEKYRSLEKENLTRFQVKEYQMQNLIQELNGQNKILEKKDFLLDAFLKVFEALESSKITYDMFFDEIIFYLGKYFAIEKLIIFQPKEGGGYKIYSKLSQDHHVKEKYLEKLLKMDGGIFLNTEINEKSGYNFIINLKNHKIQHGFVFINLDNTESLENETLFKLNKAIVQGFTHMLNNLYYVKQLKENNMASQEEIARLNQELKETEDNLELQLDEVSNMYEEIVTLYELGKKIGKIYERNELEEKVLELTLDIVEAEFGLIYYYKEKGIEISNIVNLEDEKVKNQIQMLSRLENMFFYLREKNREIIENDMSSMENFALLPKLLQEKLHNFIEVPLYQGKEINGGMVLFNKENEFTAANVSFTTSLANQLSVAVQNIDFLNKEVERRKEEEQIKLASQIQAGLFPQRMPVINGAEFFGMNIPAKAVGGDYYDLIKIDDDIVVGLIADVSGKGIPASLLMSMVRTIFRMVVTKLKETSPEKVLKIVNDVLLTENLEGKFITASCFKLNSAEQVIEVSNAGHDPLLHYKNSTAEMLEYMEGGTVLGFLEEVYEKEIIKYEKDDILMFYTDGVVEARSLDGDFFEFERLKENIINFKDESALEIINGLYRNIKDFTSGNKQNDDITIIAIKGK